MSELAFNVNGEPFEIPGGAIGWRVRRLKQKGAPEVVYGKDGAPLMLGLEADLDELRAEVSAPGRYRLDPIDDAQKAIAGAPAGYVYIHPPAPVVAGTRASAAAVVTSEGLIGEAMRMNMELARSVVDRFPAMMEAAAVLLRAADGAGLPARPGMAIVEEAVEVEDVSQADDGDDGATGPGRIDLNALVAQVVPVVMMGSPARARGWRRCSTGARRRRASRWRRRRSRPVRRRRRRRSTWRRR